MRAKPLNPLALLALVLLLAAALPGCSSAPPPREQPAGAAGERMAWWREARFGLFIHWGLYAIPAGEWKGSTNHAEWILNTAHIPVAEYEKFRARFNPVAFDADRWVRLAKRAGMKYIVITTKHHDGFCLFDSRLTDYDIMSTPWKRDIMAELAAACRREGLRICWYHSIMDWHHPDYLPRRGWEKRSAEGADFNRYLRYLRGQVTELLTNYGKIGVMWFDGEWEKTWRHEYGKALYKLCRELQPDVIVNNRVDTGRGGMAGMTSSGEYAGDFGTPEQEIPATGLPGVDWETCMTMNRHWGYNKHDNQWKSSRDLIRKLVDISSKGGNFLLNVGPTAEGRFPAPAVERLEALGRWMDVNGEAIHGTQASPFATLPWGRCTMRPGTATTKLYLHIFQWPTSRSLRVPGLGNEVVGARLLAQDRPLAWRRDASGVLIEVPENAPDEDCTVLVLEVHGRPLVYETPRITAPARVLVGSLEVRLETRSPGLEIRYTLDGSPPSLSSPRYEGPLRLEASTTVKARCFHRGRAVSEVAAATFEKVTPLPAGSFTGLEGGLRAERFAGTWDQLPDFDALKPAESWIAGGIGLPPGAREEYCGLRLRGLLAVPRDEVYHFSLTSDDGARLLVDARLVVDNDGLHSASVRQGTIALGAGKHRIQLEYFNKTGNADLELRWAPIGAKLKPIEPAALWHVSGADGPR